MLKHIARVALRLDEWLQQRLGRPYNAILGVGLIAEIVRDTTNLIRKIGAEGYQFGEVFTILLAAGLLIHQVGALSHRFEKHHPEDGEADA